MSTPCARRGKRIRRVFFDLDAWFKRLAEEPKASLVEAIRNMVVAEPQLLSVFGVPGFEETDEDDEDYYG